jgi:hypothetical protein
MDGKVRVGSVVVVVSCSVTVPSVVVVFSVVVVLSVVVVVSGVVVVGVVVVVSGVVVVGVVVVVSGVVVVGVVVVVSGVVVVGVVVVVEVLVVVSGGCCAQPELKILSRFRVTAPFSEIRRPSMVASVPTVMLSLLAMIVPTNAVLLAIVAAVGICQKTLHACAPLVRTTLLESAVMRVEVLLKIHTESFRPPPSRVRIPVRPRTPPVS